MKTLATIALLILLTGSPLIGKAFIDVTVGGNADHEIRYTSGNTICVEALVDHRWLTRYRATDGRINFANERWDDSDAFELEVRLDPATEERVSLTKGWQWVNTSEIDTNRKDQRHSVVELSSNKAPIQVKVHTLINNTAVMVRWLEISNKGANAIALMKVAPWSGRLWPQYHDFSLGYFTRTEAGHQGWFDWKTLAVGSNRINGNQGANHDDPFFVCRNEVKGEYAIGHLAWTAPWQMEFIRPGAADEPAPGLLFNMTTESNTPLRIIAPSETIRSPALHLGFLESDFDAAIQEMHEHIRNFVLPKPKRKLTQRIQFCLPGDTAYLGLPVYVDTERPDFNETTVKASIDVAAAIGAEVFMLDAWWWQHSGDWIPSKTSFPNGLDPVIKHAKKKGMDFGIYAEPEGGRGDWTKSSIGQKHPDWLINGNILNLTRPEIANYVAGQVNDIINNYQPVVYRHDFNTHSSIGSAPVTRYGFQEENGWRYYEAFYDIFDGVLQKHPQTVLQQASAGSQRLDLGTVARFHEAFLAEAGQPTVLKAYSGTSLALPPEIMVIGIGNGRDRGHLDTHLRTVYTLSTPFIISGVAPTLNQLSEKNRERYLHFSNVYKDFIRPLLPTCKVYHHAPASWNSGVESSGWFVMEFTAPDKKKGWATIVRIGKSPSETYLFKPRGLEGSKTYRVKLDNTQTTATMDGFRLMTNGLAIRLESVLSSELILFEVQ